MPPPPPQLDNKSFLGLLARGLMRSVSGGSSEPVAEALTETAQAVGQSAVEHGALELARPIDLGDREAIDTEAIDTEGEESEPCPE